jgi:spermidine/putrescine transport system substrate-binding protein
MSHDTTLTREQLVRRAIAGGVALSVPGLLPGIASAGTRRMSGGGTLVFSNWPLYIDVNEKTKRRPSLDQFTKKTGIKVKYIEDINDNPTFFGKIQGPLASGQSTGRDLIVMTDASGYPALLIQKGWLEKIDKKLVPNIKNLIPAQQHPTWDPKREYSLPWQSGMTGIGYNAKLTKPITTVDQLFTDPKLKGKVTALTEFGDSLGLVMLSNGDDPAKVTDASFNRAVTKIQKAFKSGQIRQFTGNDYSGMLAKGDIIAAFVWSGDMVQLHADNPNLRFVIPKSGGMLWTDNMLIPKGGNVQLASTYMNFVYDPKIAAEIEDYVNYICPVTGASKVLLKTDPEVAKDTLIFPTAKMLSQLHQIDPKAVFNRDYREKWQKVLGA